MPALSKEPQRGQLSKVSILIVCLMRLVIVPSCAAAAVYGCKQAGWLPADQVLTLVILLEAAGPPAINLSVMAMLHDHMVAECAALLFWLYMLSIVA